MLHIENIRIHCIKKRGVTEEFPFDQDTLVFKVLGKMFCLTSISEPSSINIKCEPEYAIELREKYEGVQPGYHMSKKHWNTIDLNSGIPDKLILQWIDDSYSLVVSSLPLKTQRELEQLL
ncbi:MAG: MmcQ/YjbR family DNA-binding protein [Bacteroidetes bacterium]|nr:MmcQ/YjbR family DNA-binding protein [Bacteroidota bacterium]